LSLETLDFFDRVAGHYSYSHPVFGLRDSVSSMRSRYEVYCIAITQEHRCGSLQI